MIPTGWSLKPLEELAIVERGKFSARPRNDPQFYGGNIPFVQTGDIRESSGWLLTHSQTLNEKGLEVSRIFPAGTILITIAANIGDVALTTYDVACPDSLVGIQAKDNVSSIWLMYALQTQKQGLESKATQNAQKNINLQVLRPLKMPTPPLAEQRKIAAILSTWDEAIALTERLMAALQQRKQGLMQRLLTGQVRFPGFEGEWREVSLSQVADVIMGQSPSSTAYNENGEGIPLIQGNADIVDRRTSPKVYTTEITKRCRIGDVILSVRAPVGETALSIHDACIGRGVCAIRAKECMPGYLYQLLVSIEKQWQSFAQGSTFTAINSTDIRNFIIDVPQSIPEQQKITEFLDLCDQQIELLHRNLDQLGVQKKGLMQRLLTGEIRVKVD